MRDKFANTAAPKVQESEITKIKAVDPLNSRKHKTLFKIHGPSLQVEFKNQQKKKEIEDTVALSASSEDYSAGQQPVRSMLQT